MENTTNATKVITGKVRASYAHVFKPHSSIEGAEAKYSICLLVPKKDKFGIAAIKEAIEAAMVQGMPKWNTKNAANFKRPANLKNPLRDGDLERPDDENYAGCYFINASSKMKPQVIDRDKNEIPDPDDFYSGCYCRASINFYPFSQAGNNGVGAGLNNLQKLADGERLGSRMDATSEFDDLEEDDLLG